MAVYDGREDGKKCYDLAIKAMREERIRDGRLQPRTSQEFIQANEGPVDTSQLDCVKWGCIIPIVVLYLFTWDLTDDTGTSPKYGRNGQPMLVECSNMGQRRVGPVESAARSLRLI